MLGSEKLVAFIPTKDFKKARQFYEKVIGLKLMSHDDFALVFKVKKNLVRVVKTDGFEPAHFTILGWEVSNIKKAVKHLQKRGVRFERYKWFEQDELSIWKAPSGSKVAWFKDRDGNILSITQKSRDT